MPRIKRIKIHNYETARVVADMLVENTGTHLLDSGGYSGRMWQRNRERVAKHGHGPIATFEDMPVSSFGHPCVYPHPNHRATGPSHRGKVGAIEEWKTENGLVDGKYTQAELWVTHNIYHWMKEALQYAPDIDKMLDELAAELDEAAVLANDVKPSWFEIYRQFPEWYAKRIAEKEAEEERETRRNGGYSDEEIEEVTAESYYEPPTGPWDSSPMLDGYEVYTYNHENCLSQDIHFIYFEHPSFGSFGEGVALIMIHNGADARGGFTRPRAFYGGQEGDSPTLFDYDRFGIGCTECSAIWDSGSGGDWNGADYEANNVLDLGEYNAREGTALDAAFLNATTGILVGDEKPWIVIEQPEGVEYPGDKTIVHCPHCGKGTLQPWHY